MTPHLAALRLRLSNERSRLATAHSGQEIALRQVWITQIEKEIAQEEAFLPTHTPADALSDDELLAELAS